VSCHIKNVWHKVRQTLECKFVIVMDKAHSVQALSWQATAVAIGNKPCCGKHAFHWHWRCRSWQM